MEDINTQSPAQTGSVSPFQPQSQPQKQPQPYIHAHPQQSQSLNQTSISYSPPSLPPPPSITPIFSHLSSPSLPSPPVSALSSKLVTPDHLSHPISSTLSTPASKPKTLSSTTFSSANNHHQNSTLRQDVQQHSEAMDVDEFRSQDQKRNDAIQPTLKQHPHHLQLHKILDDDDADELTSLSSSLSMNSENDAFSRVLDPTRRGPSTTSLARKRPSVAESHSDSESQFDSTVESHPNSDSESDPDLESKPSSPRELKFLAHSQPNVTTAVKTSSNDVRRKSLQHLAHRQDHTNTVDSTQSMSIDNYSQNPHHHHRRNHHDLVLYHDHPLQGLDVLATAARQMPRREVPFENTASLQDDSNASESEGSLALEGIDSSRKWPSMSEGEYKSKVKDDVGSDRLERQGGSIGHGHGQHYHRHHDHIPSTSRQPIGMTTSTGFSMTSASRVKDSITKDSAPRKWICRQVSVKTLGGEMMMPIWFSEEDMMLNEPAAPMELDTDRMDLDLMTGNPQASHQHHHHHRHHHHHNHHLLTEDPILALHGARHKRKMKLQDLALRESRDPQGLLEQPEIIDNKRRHGDTPAKGVKSKHSYKDYLPGEKRLKVHREYRDDGTESKLRKEKERSEKLQRLTRVRSESRASSPRGSTPATPVDNTLTEDGPFAFGSRRQPAEASPATPTGTGRPRPFICEIEDCGKRFVDALQLERHIERHGPKELECDLDMCGKLFSSLMLLRRHQSMVHKRRSEKWENPPGITRQRPGRSRRREPRIVASGDVVDPVELDRKTRTWVEVEQSGGDYSDEDDGDDEEITTRTPTKKPKESTELKQTKQPKAEERSSTKGNIKKKLVAKTEDIKSGADVDRAGRSDDGEHSARQTKGQEDNGKAAPAGPRPRPFHCTYDDCKKVFIDAIQLERHLERHGPKELECGIDGCRKRFSAQMLLRRHQSMVHKRRSPAVPVSINKGLHHQKASSTTAVATSLLNPSTAWPLSKSEAKSSSPSLQSSNEIAPLSAPASAPRSQGYNESGKK